MKKYYEMEVMIRGTIRVPLDNDTDREEVIECIQMTDNIVDIAENIERNNDKAFFVGVLKNTIKEIEM